MFGELADCRKIVASVKIVLKSAVNQCCYLLCNKAIKEVCCFTVN